MSQFGSTPKGQFKPYSQGRFGAVQLPTVFIPYNESIGAFVSQPAIIAAAANIEKVASGSFSSQPAVLYGTALRASEGQTANGAFVSQPAIIAAAANVEKVASGSFVSQPAVLSGTALRASEGQTANGAFVSQPATLAGAANIEKVASGSFLSQPAALAGAANIEKVGAVSFVSQPATLAGAANIEKVASGSFVSQPAVLSGTALRASEGQTANGAFVSQPAALAGAANIEKVGSGSFVSQPAVLSGTASTEQESPPSQTNGLIIYVNNRHDYGSGSAIPVVAVNPAKTTFDVAFAGGQAFATGPLASDMGVYVPYRSQFDQINSPNFSFFLYAAINGWQNFGQAISFPAHDSGWSPPYFDLSMGRYSTGEVGRMTYNDNGNLVSGAMGGNFWQNDGSTHSYAFTNNSTERASYKDGVLHYTGGPITGDALPPLNDVAIFNRSGYFPGEAMSGTVLVAAVWSRALTATEIAELHADPLMLVL